MRRSLQARRSVRSSVSNRNPRRQLSEAVNHALFESLEQRRLLSAQWYAIFAGMTPATTLAQQVDIGRNLLQSYGVTADEANITEAMDLSGAYFIEAPAGTTQAQLADHLDDVPGFVLVNEYQNPEIRKMLPKIALLESLYGPFDYDEYLTRIKNGEIPDGKGDVEPGPLDALVNNNTGAGATGNFTQSETSVIAWGNNVLIGFNDSGSFTGGSNQFTGYAFSTDGGTTFTDGGRLPVSAVGDAGDPVLARDETTGRIYFSTLGFSGAGTIQMWRSDTGGQTWMAPVNATPGGSSEDKQWHTVDNYAGAGQGNVYLLSRRFGAGPGIYFFRSTDQGATFGPNGGTLITSGAQGAYISVLPDHSILAFWYAGTTIQMRKSTDFGLTFGAPVTVASGLVGGTNGDLALTGIRQGLATASGFRSNEFPHAAVNPANGHIYVTFANNPAGTDKADIFMVQSTDGGATWAPAVRVNDDATLNDQWQPTLAVSPDGSRLGIFYYSREQDPGNNLFHYYGRIGTISGSDVSFLPSFAISDAPSLPEFGRDSVVNSVYMSDYDTAFATPGYFHVVWSANYDDLAGGAPRKDPNVYYDKIPLGLVVASTVPSVGSVVSSAPTSFVVNFSDAIDASSVDANDFSVNGIAADSFVVDDSESVTFSYISSPVTAQGLQSMSMADGSILRDGDSDPLLAFNGSFRYDVTTLQVVSTTPAFPGGIFSLPGPFNLDVDFNEPIDPASVGAGDLVLSGIPGAIVTGFSILDADSVRFNLAGINTEGTLTASISANAITDVYGNAGTNFSANYDVDIGTVAYPVPLGAKKPNGSLVYDPSISGIIGFAGDEDAFFLDVDPNQNITVKVTSSGGLTPSFELRDPTNAIIGTATAGGANQTALLQTAAASIGGTYLVRVSGASGSTGNYTVQVVLNAALEDEANGGGDNDSLGNAQDITPSFLGFNTGLGSFSRGAVLGTTDIAGYSGEAVPFEFEDISGTGTRVLVNVDDSSFNVPLGFSFPFYNGSFANAFASSNGLIAFGSSNTAFTNADLTASPTQAAIAPFWDDLHTNSGAADAGVYYQTLGSGATLRTVIQWHNVRFFSGGTAGDTLTFQAVLFADGVVQFNYADLVSGTATGNNGGSATVGNKNAGTQGPDRLLLAFNNGPNSFVGTGQSTRINLPDPTPDLYALTLTAGQKVTISATNPNDGSGAGLDLSLLDSGGGTVASGTGGSTNLGEVLTYTPAASGTYYVSMTGASSVPYNVVVTDAAAFDTEDNNAFASPQSLSGFGSALGAISLGGAYIPAAITHAFEDISGTGTVIAGLTNVDDAAVSIPVGFNFPFYGANQSSIFVSSNGLLTFGTGNSAFTNADLTASPAQAAIAPFWDDLHTAGGQAGSNVFFQVSGAGTNQHLTVQWNQVRFFSGGTAGDTLTFQAQLFADGRIVFNYADLVSGSAGGNNGASATVGIKNAGTQGPDRVLLAFNNGPNAFVGTGQSTAISQPPGEDWYSIDVDVSTDPLLRLSTITPSDGPGELVNTLNPRIELYDPSGVLIASGSALADGRNEQIGWQHLTASGTYRVRVLGESDTIGEYALGYDQSGMLIDDPCLPGTDAVLVGGTAGNDTIQVKLNKGWTEVWLNGGLLGKFDTGLRVIAYGGAGNDTIENLTAFPVIFFGGDGNDTLKSLNGSAILLGGAGNDTEIASGNGRDILIGGLGTDSLKGGSGDDILIGGATAYDDGLPAALDALCDAMEIWGNKDVSYESRTSTLLGGIFSSGNIFGDSSADTLRGENGRDWFFSTSPDVLPDKASSELLS